MSYKLIVTKLVHNEKYEEELAESQRNRLAYGGSPRLESSDWPSRTSEKRSLEVELTDEEYQVIRRALIQHWEASNG